MGRNIIWVARHVYASLIVGLEQHGAAVLTEEETARFLRAARDEQTQRFRPHIIGQDAARLAELAQIHAAAPSSCW